MSKGKRWLLNLGILSAAAFADKKLPEDTPLKWLVKEVLLDAPPEIGSRIIRGSPESTSPSLSPPSDHKTTGQSPLQLDKQELEALLSWLKGTSPEDRLRFRNLVSGLSKEELRRLAGLPPELKECLLDVVQPSAAKKKLRDDVQSDLDEAHRRLDESLKSRRGEKP